MITGKRFYIVTSFLFIYTGLTSTAYAKTVYVISNTNEGVIRAYEVQDSNLVYQAQYDSDIIYSIGLAIDPCEEFLFVTHENFEPVQGNEIEIVNAKTMQYVNTVTALGATDLAGIAMDTGNSKIYVVDRYTNHLYSYSWDAVSKTLTPDFGDPYYITLEGIVTGSGRGAFGIALDEENDLLYVADNTDSIKYYDTNNWSKDGEVNNVSCNVISIAIDGNNQLLYYGSMGAYGEGDPCLYQYNLSSSLEQSVYIGCSVAGIAVDQQTSLIYITTFGSQYDTNEPYPKDRLFVFDADLTEQWVSDGIGNPAGVAVAGDVSYKEPFPLVTFVKDVNDANCVYPFDLDPNDENYLTYKITYDANGHADTGVFITDYLPDEVDYNSSDPCGLYDPDKRTVTWEIGDMPGSDSNTLLIQVKVNYYAKPGETIKNYCEIESDEYCTFTTWLTEVCCYGGNIIYVNQDAHGCDNGTCWQDAYADLQDALTEARECGCEQIWVAEGMYKPTKRRWDKDATFDLVEDVAVYGGFPNSGDPNFSDRDYEVHITTLSGDIATPNDQSDNSYHVVKCEDVNNTILDGFTITAGNAKGSGDDGYGGGVHCKDSTNLTLKSCNLSDTTAYNGGGMYNQYSSASLIDCIFSDNTVTYYGGGLYIMNSTLYVTDCVFTGNTVTSGAGQGGAMYNYYYSSATVANCIFSGNTAYEAAGVHNDHHSEVNLSNCIFAGNTASSGGGGAMKNKYYSSVAIANCIFSGNRSYSYGGGLYNDNNCNLALTNCTLSSNWTYYGGGIFNLNSDLDVNSCILWANVADTDYNEIYTDDPCTVNISYSDIKDSNGSGPCWGQNLGNDIGYNIDVDPCFKDVNYSVGTWTKNPSYDSSTFQSTLTNSDANWGVNELAGNFVNPDVNNQALQFFIVSNDVNTIKVWGDVRTIAHEDNTYKIFDYHLKDDSNCMDAGDPNGDYNGQTDIDGESRVMGDIDCNAFVDMGADEVYFPNCWNCRTQCHGDSNCDGIVNITDFFALKDSWLACHPEPNYNPCADFNRDGCVNISDFFILKDNWNTSPEPDCNCCSENPNCDWPPSGGGGGGGSKSEGKSYTDGDIEELLEWLDELWLTNKQTREAISEDEWLKFVESVIQSIKEQM